MERNRHKHTHETNHMSIESSSSPPPSQVVVLDDDSVDDVRTWATNLQQHVVQQVTQQSYIWYYTYYYPRRHTLPECIEQMRDGVAWAQRASVQVGEWMLDTEFASLVRESLSLTGDAIIELSPTHMTRVFS